MAGGGQSSKLTYLAAGVRHHKIMCFKLNLCEIQSRIATCDSKQINFTSGFYERAERYSAAAQKAHITARKMICQRHFLLRHDANSLPICSILTMNFASL